MSETIDPVLEEKVARRIAFLKQVAEFVQMIAVRRGARSDGDLRKSASGDGPVSGIYTLGDFGGFIFRIALSGIRELQIWEARLAEAKDKNSHQVLAMSWKECEGVEQATVHTFEQSPAWANSLLAVIRNWEQVAAQIDAKRGEAAKIAEAERERQKRLDDLHETARRLGVI